MKKIPAFLAIFSICLFTSVAFAEPTNLQSYKNQLKQYEASGDYLQQQQQVANQAQSYLAKYIAFNAQSRHPQKLAIVLDIDETALSNYPDMLDMNFGGTLDEINKRESRGKDPVIAPTLGLYNYAKQHGVSVFFVTGRPAMMLSATVRNLKTTGYKHWDGMVLRTQANKKQSAEIYKTAIRKKLENQGYVIVINMGDQESDLIGGYAEKGFKLPNPYYYIP